MIWIILGFVFSLTIGFVIGINKGSNTRLDSDTIARMSSR